MSQPRILWWQKFGTLAQMAQAAVALLGFIAILIQINTAARNAHEAAVRQIYQAYNQIEFQNPQYSSPDYERIKTASRDEQTQYESFVSYFLYACEEARAVFEDKREWQASCDYDLKNHLPFLCEKNVADPAYLLTYSGDTQRWIKTAMQQSGVTAPDCKLRKT